ncbi:acyl-CoA thioesterase [Variovorax sp. J22G73]|jgi:4-hydroxybenzoyl-CoA thioesterase|uniref:acyl-CoA thioesterase n=1 Tax=unclassified Variovorax TaxID=663243 RepID=UPI002576F44D|nr:MULTISPECIES: acyl-CoA thioesterase [unclassified Variovorax]MDM0005286.1 acyl-CoA thioesterase [Variovorax sp. J22R203]MDM0098702.1 acyl-CoA thioesterase [Variovorax sp. J22G73]
MSNSIKEIVYTARVEFGDCDPAGIVWFPNFFRWIDAASRHFFAECGVPRWEETTETLGVIGTPLVDTHTRFVKTASYGDTLHIAVRVTEWREKSFVQTYRVTRGSDLILECEEVRIFAAKREGGGIRAVGIPASIRVLCE